MNGVKGSHRLTRQAALVCACLLLTACYSKTDPEPIATPPAHPLDQVQSDEPVLASVNGSRIGENDLGVYMARTLGDAYPQLGDVRVENEVLRSMIASRAIALKALEVMPEADRIALEKRIAQYREELLVRAYLLDSSDAAGVTDKQVATYYQQHPEEFAGATERLYELITVARDDYRRDPEAAVATLSLAKTHDDWPELVQSLSDQPGNLPLAHSYQRLVGENDTGTIAEAVRALADGDISRLVYSDGAPYLLRLISTEPGEPLPLEQVREKIRRDLLPASVRRSVQAVSDQVLGQSDIIINAAAE